MNELSHQPQPAYFPIALHSFHLAWQHADGAQRGDTHGPLYCFADKQLLICSLNHEMKMVPRRIDLPGKAQKLTYSPVLRSLIVSYEILEVENPEAPFVTTTTSHIEFVDPNSQSPVVHGDKNSPWRPTSSRGEIISCMLDWVYQKDRQTYHMLAVGTTMPSTNTSESGQGRLILLLPRQDPSDPSRIECTTSFVRTVESPIRALASYHDSILVGSGDRLIPMAAKGSLMKWRRNAVGSLPSTATKIVVHDTEIHVMTSRHSWIIFQVMTSQRDPSEGAELVRISWDPSPRDGLSHILHEGSKPFMLSSHRGGRVTAFPVLETKPIRAPSVKLPNSYPTANLPESILQFVTGGKNDDYIYGFTVHGTVLRFLVPEEKQVALLLLLQNLCIRDKEISPSTSRGKRLKNPLVLDAHGTHVDGDILSRLVNRGPSYLSSLIGQLDARYDSDRARMLFTELATRALGENSTEEAVFSWLGRLLDVSFGPH